MTKIRHKIVPSSYLVLIENNKILLQRRFNTGYEDGNYGFVAGHVEEGESFTDAVIREIKEEIGVMLKLEDLRVIHVMHRKSISDERIDVFFMAKKWTGEIENKEPDKCDDLSWFDVNNLPDNIIPYVRQALDGIKNRIFYSEHGW